MNRLLHPRLLAVHLLAIVCFGAAVGLGMWQWNSWQAARAAEAVDLTNAEPRPLTDVMGPDAPFPGADVGRPVTLRGSWVPEGTVYVSGREYRGEDGFWVVTPVAVDAGPQEKKPPALLVVRGWAPEVDAAPVPPTGPVEVTGWLQPTEGTGADDPNPRDDVLPQLRLADAIQHVDQDLYSGYAVSRTPYGDLSPASPEQLPQANQFTGLRNVLYALEWWFFAFFVLFIWWRWARDVLDEADPAQPTTDGTTDHITDASPADDTAPSDAGADR